VYRFVPEVEVGNEWWLFGVGWLRRWCGQVEVADIHCYGVGATCSGIGAFPDHCCTLLPRQFP
jgi:hypothetical protein